MKAETALLIIDVQAGMFPETDPVYAGDLLLDRVGRLIAEARSCDVPVIYVQHNEGPGAPLESNSPGWKIHPMVGPVEGDVIIQKYSPDAFHETNLQEELTARGVKKLVLAGIQTDCCVDATCRGAHSLGYEVILAKDAHSTWGQGNQTAEQIIDQYNEALRSYADLEESARIKFLLRS
ncbi:MAG: isochorismatase [Cohnella sp.]|jgi:nicotinamidase-related amidase|nr:isochorismatase [Cohnella sp.]